jgi:hypothetical protein
VDVTLKSGERVIGRSGGLNPEDGEVDPWSHFVNVYMLDRHGNRIDRRNPQDIFTPLYNHQIPPGAADSLHYSFRVPHDVGEPITAEVKLLYRKFDTTYMRHFQGSEFVYNDLPISTLATDTITFPIDGMGGVTAQDRNVAALERLWHRPVPQGREGLGQGRVATGGGGVCGGGGAGSAGWTAESRSRVHQGRSFG